MTEHLTAEQIQGIADGESDPGEHVRECARCANAIVGAMQMKRAVREAMRGEPAPASLRRRVRASRGTWNLFGAAAAMALIVTGAVLITRQQQPGAFAELADMHVTMLASANPVDVLSTDKHTVKPWFEGRVPFSVPVPDLASTPFRLIGGRVVYWRGNPAAYMLIGKGAHRISVFAFRPEGNLGAAPKDLSAVSWQNEGLEFVAIADVPEADLAQLRAAF